MSRTKPILQLASFLVLFFLGSTSLAWSCQTVLESQFSFRSARKSYKLARKMARKGKFELWTCGPNQTVTPQLRKRFLKRYNLLVQHSPRCVLFRRGYLVGAFNKEMSKHLMRKYKKSVAGIVLRDILRANAKKKRAGK